VRNKTLKESETEKLIFVGMKGRYVRRATNWKLSKNSTRPYRIRKGTRQQNTREKGRAEVDGMGEDITR
jgi:hypothetical protein